MQVRIDLDYGTIEPLGRPGTVIGQVSGPRPGAAVVFGFLDDDKTRNAMTLQQGYEPPGMPAQEPS